MIPDGFQRARKGRPCPVCGRPDWCLVAADGDRAVCARVVSPRKWGKAGWLHVLSSSAAPAKDAPLPEWSAARRAELAAAEAVARGAIDFPGLARQFAAALTAPMLDELADLLGLAPGVLRELGAGHAHRHPMPVRDGPRPRPVTAWSFPMRDGAGEVVGLRLRGRDGAKFSYTYSANGLFVPDGLRPAMGAAAALFCPEGPTSAAALRMLGLRAVGRPNNTLGGAMLADYCRRLRPYRVVLVGDNDAKEDGRWPGRDGAEQVAAELRAAGVGRDVSVALPPPGVKDAREWVRLGAGRDDVLDWFRRCERRAAPAGGCA